MKKKLKDTKGFSIIKKLIGGAIEATPLSAFKSLIDVDKDGKITRNDFAKMEWYKIIGSIAGVGVLIHFDILSLEIFQQLFMMVVNGLLGQ